MNISIFGLGYVGCVSLGCLAKNGHKVVGVDISQLKIDRINNGKATIIEKDIDDIIRECHQNGRIKATIDYHEAIMNTELTIIAVGTPSTANGQLNLEYIFNAANHIGESIKNKNSFHIIAIRSTVLPGTCEKFTSTIENISGKKENIDFAVLSNPEFLREGSAIKDYYNPPLTLIGSDNDKAAKKLASLYTHLPAEIIITDIKIAEFMKYINNAFHALKISFANEIGNICKALDIDSHEVMEIFTKDKQLNISPYYFKPGFAYGGSCLPKDLKALQTLAHDQYLKVPIIENIDKTNDLQIKRAIDMITQFPGKKLGFLGLSFKAGTDDLRNSPSVAVVEYFLREGYEILIYDKNVHISRLTGMNKEYIDNHLPYLSNLLVKSVDDLLETSEVIIIINKEDEFSTLLNDVSDKIIIDLVRLNENLLCKSNYHGINW
jgi:GDP-mannose 6-dehydrogenase